MYAGFFPSHKHQSQWLGTHQKFNRIAYRIIRDKYSDSFFPDVKMINKFEGPNGPDGIKTKSPSQHEPWHYYDPLDESDNQLVNLLENHLESLAEALRNKNHERAAFEASWLAHGITDGMTPAHQYPYERELQDITGIPKEERTTKKKKVFAEGQTNRELIKKNWQLWGTKGLMTTHHAFEIGVATIVLPMRFKKVDITVSDISNVRDLGLGQLFKNSARNVAKYHMYERFYRSGWNTGLARDAREMLAPSIIRTVSLAWALALEDSQK